ncbi:MAG: tRNA-dihydrouridine synthase family protein [Roseburia sp.]|nr:tRNA-dihydrouridine synthase family protein [Roseburia sp.]
MITCYLAPMEGITTYIYRSAYNRYFGGIDKYFTPFIASRKMNSRERSEILPEHNEGLLVVPQILTNRAEEFLQIAEQITAFGYRTVNLNLGCPSGTVTARKRGAGFLGVPEQLDEFLYDIFEKSPLKISIKTRIGVSSEEEWDRLLAIYQKYPIEELIIHPRLQQEQYGGTPHKGAYRKAQDRLQQIPLCYNGDIHSPDDFMTLASEFPDISRVMLERGILKDPYLVSRLRQDSGAIYDKSVIKAFHDEIFARYAEAMSGETPVLYKMKDLWTYLSQSFTNPEKYLKKIRKANSFADYKTAVNALLREQELLLQ